MSFQAIVSQFFQWQTSVVVRWPLPFLIIPPVIAMSFVTFCAVDFHVNVTNQTLQVFLPDNMQSLTDLQKLMEWFPPRDAQRDTYSIFGSKFVYAVLEDTATENLLTPQGISHLATLHKHIVSIKADNGVSLQEVCLKEPGETSCILHPLLYALEDENPLMAAQMLFWYPMLSFGEFSVDNVLLFGNVTVNKKKIDRKGNSAILKASAVRLAYPLEDNTNTERYDQGNSFRWMMSFITKMKEYGAGHTNTSVYFTTSISLPKEMERNGDLLIPWMPWTALVLVVFCMIICSSRDLVRSQPWIGFFAMFNATLATVSSTSFLIWMGYPFLPLVFIMPFLVVSIGTDNMFLMLKSWRMTNAEKMEDRFTEALTETAASLFLTSLTDGLSFSIGSISDFYAVRVFCTYCAMAILFMFLLQITFFNAVMVFCCRRENSRRNAWCCWIGGTQFSDEKLFASRPLPALPTPPLGDLLCRVVQPMFSRIIIAIFYLIYIATAAKFAFELPLGLDMKLLAPDGSYVAAEMLSQHRLFNDYGAYCFAVVETPNELLAEKKNRAKLIQLYNNMTRSNLASKAEFWLEDFAHFEDKMEDFATNLHTFLAKPGNKKYITDIRFSLNGSIEAIKWIMRVRNLTMENDHVRAQFLRGQMEQSGFEGFVYDTSFLLVDQQLTTVYNVITNVVTAIITMLVICIFMVPRPVSAMCIGFSILSINVGVVGALSLSGTRLDIISMITIVMSIGFSVDYVTHTTFHYVIQKENRLKKCLVVMTEPILQSGLSTAVGVSLLVCVPSYIVRTFVYTVFFVVVIGILHGLLFLPALLHTVVPKSEYLQPYHEKQEESSQDHAIYYLPASNSIN